jgi:hypothetical protein
MQWMWIVVIMMGFGMMSRHWGGRTRGRHRGQPLPDPQVGRDLAEQRDYLEALEARVRELENRLDFTERLLVERTREGDRLPA